MAKWTFTNATWTPANVADTTTMANAGFMALGAGSASQMINIQEIFIQGQAAASTINQQILARDSTLGATPTALASPNSNGPLNPNTAALAAPQTAFVACTTNPQRSSSAAAARLSLSYNSFGGIVRWQAAPGEEWQVYGTALGPPPAGESSISAFAAGAGAQGTSIIYEPF